MPALARGGRPRPTVRSATQKARTTAKTAAQRTKEAAERKLKQAQSVKTKRQEARSKRMQGQSSVKRSKKRTAAKVGVGAAGVGGLIALGAGGGGEDTAPTETPIGAGLYKPGPAVEEPGAGMLDWEAWLAAMGGAPPSSTFDPSEYEASERMLLSQAGLAREDAAEGRGKITGAYKGLETANRGALERMLAGTTASNAAVQGRFDEAQAKSAADTAALQESRNAEFARLGMSPEEIAKSEMAVGLDTQEKAVQDRLGAGELAWGQVGALEQNQVQNLGETTINVGKLQGQESLDDLQRNLRKYLTENANERTSNQAKKAAAARAFQEQEAKYRWEAENQLRKSFMEMQMEQMGASGAAEGADYDSGMGGALSVIEMSNSPMKDLMAQFFQDVLPDMSPKVRHGGRYAQTPGGQEKWLPMSGPSAADSAVAYFKQYTGQSPTPEDERILRLAGYKLAGGYASAEGK